jgi:hypothetical protein
MKQIERAKSSSQSGFFNAHRTPTNQPTISQQERPSTQRTGRTLGDESPLSSAGFLNLGRERAMGKPKLGWCPICREFSTIVRVSQKGRRTEICINKGCGHVVSLPEISGKVLENSNERA